jgi:hypothetical protein
MDSRFRGNDNEDGFPLEFFLRPRFARTGGRE